MIVAAKTILISTAFQSNGNLSYTLNIKFIFKVPNFSDTFSKITSTRFKNLLATWNRIANAKGKEICTYVR